MAWDLFNEPDNPNRNSYGRDGFKTELPEDVKAQMATRLLAKVFAWAREAGATQPLTAGVWRGDWSSHDKLTPYNKLMLEQSDVISFHCYDPIDDMKQKVAQLRRYGRPLLCTEYMSRGSGSTFDPIMGFSERTERGRLQLGPGRRQDADLVPLGNLAAAVHRQAGPLVPRDLPHGRPALQ